jgi:gluconolactonase
MDRGMNCVDRIVRRVERANWMRFGILAAFSFIVQGACGATSEAPTTVASSLQFPEGTVFIDNTLYFVDFATSDVFRLVGSKVEKVWHQEGCGANGLAQVPDGLMVACYQNGTFVTINLDGKLLETLRQDSSGAPFLAPNDLTLDHKGGVYFTGSGGDGVLGKVYYRAGHGPVTPVAREIQFANGLAVSPDGKVLYVAETQTSLILQYSVHFDGSLGPRSTFVDLKDILVGGHQRQYRPDGVRVDDNGNLFVGLYDGGGYAIVGPDGRLVRQIEVAGTHHANLAISPSGADIYLTSVEDVPGGYLGSLLRIPNPLHH